jgi:hypothetical protein
MKPTNAVVLASLGAIMEETITRLEPDPRFARR